MRRHPRRRTPARTLLWQGLLLAAVAGAALYLAGNARANLAARGITFGFAFLATPAGFDIPFRIPAWSTSDTYARAL